MNKIAAFILALCAHSAALGAPQAACEAQSACASEQAQFDAAHAEWRRARSEIVRDSAEFERRVSALVERSKALPVGARPGSEAGKALKAARVRALGHEGPLLELFELDPSGDHDGRRATLIVRHRYQPSSLFRASGSVYGWQGRERLNRDKELAGAMPELIAALKTALPAQWRVVPDGSERILIVWPAAPLSEAEALWRQWSALELEYAREKEAFERRQAAAFERRDAQEGVMERLRPITWLQRLAATPKDPSPTPPRFRPSRSSNTLDDETPRLILSSF